ncbi:hypothetical protein DRO32_00820, partial [Candidatus Bathyarchaeota archaeon]
LLASKEIWLCASCFRCVDRCPRGVGFTNISIALRNLAAREGNIPEALRAMASTVVETGLAYKIPLSRLRMREKQGLPPLPSVNIEQVRALVEEAGLPELVAKKGGR